MTIVEIKNQLLSHFFENTVFNMSSHIDKIELTEEISPMKSEIVRTVLNELELLGLVRKVASSNNEVWILVQSLHSFHQNLSISAATAEIIADTINSFREANEIDGDTCDKTKITESDILNLVNISHIMAESPSLDQEQEEDEK